MNQALGKVVAIGGEGMPYIQQEYDQGQIHRSPLDVLHQVARGGDSWEKGGPTKGHIESAFWKRN